ncbi:hypothetical protein SERLADRAFT_443550 [Serpula lacrymans var. lacrymans S7.9]|uniref:Uncharacterized protein n=1 Tax=Serpula lacrymans var. lacrymans (strain S7.9) TaxID=578457 RepID=F8PCQ9_SERL9|nr:uncharacterized protein SERLADRAFT_443550 [Serpula lacrymans var. lacrymans S7.9]EGO19008.1 hypothetical protein SERLADRAFT_443550 [Serpula lacrymans var. lacrymans S7.9]
MQCVASGDAKICRNAETRKVPDGKAKAHFDQEEAKRSEKAKERAAKDAQKAVDEAIRTAHIHEDTVSKNFEKPLSSYKRKDDLITVAGALQLSTTGTVKELLTRIKTYLDEHGELAGQPRFAGLFGHRAPNMSSSASGSGSSSAISLPSPHSPAFPSAQSVVYPHAYTPQLLPQITQQYSSSYMSSHVPP